MNLTVKADLPTPTHGKQRKYQRPSEISSRKRVSEIERVTPLTTTTDENELVFAQELVLWRETERWTGTGGGIELMTGQMRGIRRMQLDAYSGHVDGGWRRESRKGDRLGCSCLLIYMNRTLVPSP